MRVGRGKPHGGGEEPHGDGGKPHGGGRERPHGGCRGIKCKFVCWFFFGNQSVC